MRKSIEWMWKTILFLGMAGNAVAAKPAPEPEPARHVVVMLMQDDLLVDVAHRSSGHGRGLVFRDWKEVVLGLAASALYSTQVTVLDEHTLGRALGMPPGEFDMARGILASVTAQFPPGLVAPEARVHLTYGLPAYIRARRALKGEPLLGMTLTYAISADLRAVGLSAMVDYGLLKRGHPKPRMQGFTVTRIEPGSYASGKLAAPGVLGYWLDNDGERLRQAMLASGRDLGKLIAGKYGVASAWTRQDERALPTVRMQNPADPMVFPPMARVLEDRGAQLLLSQGSDRALVDRALVDFPSKRR